VTTVLAFGVLSGCASYRVSPDELPPIPANLLQQCPPLTGLANGKPETIANQMIQDARVYSECASRHRNLVEVIRFREGVYNIHKEAE